MTYSTRSRGTSVPLVAGCAWALIAASPAFSQQSSLPQTKRAPNAGAAAPAAASPGTARVGNPRAAGAERAGTATLDDDAPREVRSALREEQATSPRGPGVMPAAGDNVQVLALPRELEPLIREWERKSKTIERLSGKFTRYKYDSVFETESRATGGFWYAKPDKGRMDFNSVKLDRLPRDSGGKPINPAKKGVNGQPYKVSSDPRESWICTGDRVLQIQVQDKTYNEITIPEQFRGAAIRNSPLPFLFGLNEEEARSRYVLRLGSMHKKVVEDGPEHPIIHVVAFPMLEQDAREWSRAEVLLHSDTFLPYSILVFDPAGTTQIVYVFTESKSNERWTFKDPFNVSTTGLTLIQKSEAGPPPASVQPAAAAGPPANGRTAGAATSRRD
ncbi:MAG: hypothetical protein KF774_12275 [Planctomyces sp.]|nr:hypothetical protein [Planctomyces sp.]